MWLNGDVRWLSVKKNFVGEIERRIKWAEGIEVITISYVIRIKFGVWFTNNLLSVINGRLVLNDLVLHVFYGSISEMNHIFFNVL